MLSMLSLLPVLVISLRDESKDWMRDIPDEDQ